MAVKYRCPIEIKYYSPRYDKYATVPLNYPSDGATGGIDIWSKSWWVHDLLCGRGTWDDGVKITNWEASQVLRDILISENRKIRAFWWFWATWVFGGGNARGNGMF